MDTKNRARLCILSELLSFPTITGKNWQSQFSETEAMPGDLVSICSAPVSKWYLSWLLEIDPNKGWPKYLLESIDDGELCWWENVGLNFYNRGRVRDNPHWKWVDKQFEFADRWYKTCRRLDGYMVLPVSPIFIDDGSVILNVRIRYGMDKYQNPKTFQNYKKTTMKQMGEYYKECCEGFERTTLESTGHSRDGVTNDRTE